MRHIPDEELHAYLDQGLSRSQCVEIESHLAACSACQSARDNIAALRDRTTALLAKLAPPRSVPPAFEVLRRRAAAQASERRRRIHRTAWAASLIAAVGLGWTASYFTKDSTTRPATARRDAAQPVAPSELSAPVAVATRPDTPAPRVPQAVREEKSAREPKAAPEIVAPPAPARVEPASAPNRDSARAVALAVLDQPPPARLTPAKSPRPQGASDLEGKWRTISWDGARTETGEEVPHVEGLPVVDIQVLTNDPTKRPLMVVAQQLSSGQVIQTIEGPASDVSQLIARRAGADSLGPGDIRLEGLGGDQAMAMQRGDRMLAIFGALPSDSLRAMIRRLNAEMRSK